MDNSLASNYSSLKEMILDEEKLVTYVSLSKELCIHTNVSKVLLCKFVDENSDKHLLSANYIISGITGDNRALTTVCTKPDLETQRKCFKTVLFEHIYSVARGKPSIDNGAYLSVNRIEDFPLYLGLIKSNICTKRSSTEIGDLKLSSQNLKNSLLETNVPVKLEKNPKNEVNGHKETTNGDKNVAKLQETKSEPIIKKEIQLSKSNHKNNAPKAQKGIAGFFSKSNSIPIQKVSVKEEMTQDNITNGINDKKQDAKMETSEEPDAKKKPQIKVVSKKEQIKETKVKPNKNNQILDQIKKTAKVDKKRKRLLKVSDSESDEEVSPFADEPSMEPDNHSEDEIPATPSVNTVKITSGIMNPKKKRKIVDKTYTDEEGYILTKKVEIYESCSDNEEVNVEEERSTKENIPKNVASKIETSPKQAKVTSKPSKKKISPPQKGKQATLMNFFKKV